MEKLYTIAEVAESFQMPKSTLTELCKREGWPHHRLGKAIRFTEAQVEEILARHLVAPKPKEDLMFPGARPRRR